jgi:hypothetical protein
LNIVHARQKLVFERVWLGRPLFAVLELCREWLIELFVDLNSYCYHHLEDERSRKEFQTRRGFKVGSRYGSGESMSAERFK